MVDTDRLLPNSTTASPVETDQHENAKAVFPDTGTRNRIGAFRVVASTGVVRREEHTELRGRLRQSLGPVALAVVAVGIAVLVLAFLAGRLTAPSDAHAAPALTPVHGRATGMELPQLSQAAPVPPLAARPKPRITVKVRTVPVPVPTTTAVAPAPKPKHKAPAKKKAPSPVTIVGHG
jgi:hypothetical protein